MNYQRVINIFSSEHRLYDNGTPSSFSQGTNTRMNVKKLKLLKATIPNTAKNITSFNNTLTIVDDGSTSYTITLDEGLYSADDLVTHINTKLVAAGTSSLISYSNNRFTLTAGSVTVKVDLTNTTLKRHVGLDRGIETADLAVLDFPNVAVLSDVEFYLQIEPIGAFESRIPLRLDTGQGSIFSEIVINDSMYSGEFTHPKIMSFITFKLYDIDGNIVDLQGAPVSYVIQFESE